MKVQVGRWYWTSGGLILNVLRLDAIDLANPYVSVTVYRKRTTLGKIGRHLVGTAYLTETGRLFLSSQTICDAICEPASLERIVFPHPSTCPRWCDALKREQKEAEEVLFDASLL